MKTYLAVLMATALLAAGLTPGGGEGGQAMFLDGTYVGYSDADATGYAVATVVIARDQIVGVNLTEFMGHGEEKDWETYPWEEAVQARNQLAREFVVKNSTDVDTITGATGSSEKYKQAVARALENALVEPARDNTYFDGTFQGQAGPNEYGQWSVARVTIEKDRIINVVLEETTGESNEFKDADYPYEPYHRAREEMARRFLAANSAGVDAFTGATGSSAGWIAAVENALEHARR
jgi:uncharacterized protein with FMN-binding domain